MSLDAIRERLVDELAAAELRAVALRATLDGIVESAEDVATDDEHDPEGHTIAFERQQVASLLQENRAQAAEIADALARLDSGGYGTCEVCGEAIDQQRLETLPAARRCITCARSSR